MAKEFDAAAVKTDRVYSDLEQATGKRQQQATASAEEIAERRENLRTQGRKGVKAVRLNVAFTPKNHQFIKVYASSTGQTTAEAVNEMIDFARTDPRFLERAKKQLESLINNDF